MGTGRARRRRRRRRPAMDRISDFPDEILHSILLRLPSTAEAAPTSVLSRRWRGVWAHAPALSFRSRDQAPGASIYNAIDAALGAHAAPALDCLEISINHGFSCYDPGARVAPWLRFASARVAGELSLRVVFAVPCFSTPTPAKDVELPACERATAIDLHLQQVLMRLRIPAAGTFAALRALRISGVNLEVSDFERAVSSQCPRLEEVALSDLVNAGDLSIRSDSLERLKRGRGIRGEVTVQAPRLVRLEMGTWPSENIHGAHISAPNLAEVIWHHTYDPRCHKIVEAGRHLRRLQVIYLSTLELPKPTMAGLFQRFDTVDELDVQLKIGAGDFEYEAFWMDTEKLPRCKVLKIRLGTSTSHALDVIVSHLLMKCSSARKLDLHWVADYSLFGKDEQEGCSCCHVLGTEDVVLNALEEVDLSFSKVGVCEEGLVKLLLRSCGAALRRLGIHMLCGPPSCTLSTATRERIIGFCRPETVVEFYDS